MVAAGVSGSPAARLAGSGSQIIRSRDRDRVRRSMWLVVVAGPVAHFGDGVGVSIPGHVSCDLRDIVRVDHETMPAQPHACANPHDFSCAGDMGRT